LDYILSDFNFSSPDERGRAIENAVKYGTVGGRKDLKSIRVGLGLISSYAPNGQAISSEIERKFLSDADSIKGGIISELVRKLKVGAVFPTARELQASAYAELPLSGEALTIEARAALGAMLDFCEVDRRAFLGAVGSGAIDPVVSNASSSPHRQTSLSLDPPPESP